MLEFLQKNQTVLVVLLVVISIAISFSTYPKIGNINSKIEYLMQEKYDSITFEIDKKYLQIVEGEFPNNGSDYKLKLLKIIEDYKQLPASYKTKELIEKYNTIEKFYKDNWE